MAQPDSSSIDCATRSRALVVGAVLWGIDQMVFRGKAPWTLHRTQPDHAKLKPAAECAPIDYPKPDSLN